MQVVAGAWGHQEACTEVHDAGGGAGGGGEHDVGACQAADADGEVVGGGGAGGFADAVGDGGEQGHGDGGWGAVGEDGREGLALIMTEGTLTGHEPTHVHTWRVTGRTGRVQGD